MLWNNSCYIKARYDAYSCQSFWTYIEGESVMIIVLLLWAIINYSIFRILYLKYRTGRIAAVDKFMVTLPIVETLFIALTIFLHWPICEKWSIIEDTSSVLCKLILPYIYHVMRIYTAYATSVIVMDRYQMIIHSVERITQRFKIYQIIMGLWLLSFLSATPVFFPFRMKSIGNSSIYDGNSNGDEIQARIYYLYETTVEFMVPELIMIIFTWKAIKRINEYKRERTQLSPTRELPTKRILILLASPVLLFTIFWLPYQSFRLISFTFAYHLRFHKLIFISYITDRFSWLASPFAAVSYWILDSNFFKNIRNMFCCCCECVCSKRHSVTPTDEITHL